MFLTLAAVLLDPFPWLPPERVCIERHKQTVVLLEQARCRLTVLLWNEDNLYGGTFAYINRHRISGYIAYTEWEIQEAMELKEFWWDAWWARWSDPRCLERDRFQHAGFCRTYLGDVALTPHWWEPLETRNDLIALSILRQLGEAIARNGR
jgi:hypothetical protein